MRARGLLAKRDFGGSTQVLTGLQNATHRYEPKAIHPMAGMQTPPSFFHRWSFFLGRHFPRTRLQSDFIRDAKALPENALSNGWHEECYVIARFKYFTNPATQNNMAKTNDTANTATSDTVRDSRDQLIEDLKRVIEDAQNLAEEAKDASGAAIHDKIMAVQKDLGKRMKNIRKTGGNVIDEVEQQSENIEDLIRRYPWYSIGVAALAGLLVDRIILK